MQSPSGSERAKRQSLAAAIGIPKPPPPPPQSRAERVRQISAKDALQVELPSSFVPSPRRPSSPPPAKAVVVAEAAPSVAIDVKQKAATAAAAPSSSSSYADTQLRRIRRQFVRKVFGILACQLAVTFAVVLLFSFSAPVKQAVQSSLAGLFAAAGIMLFFLLALTCFPCVASRFPRNYVCLFLFTAAEAYLVGACASFYEPFAVSLAMGGTVLAVVGLTLFAWQSRFPWSNFGGALVILLCCFVLFGSVIAAVPSRMAQTAYAALGCLIFSFFILVDVSLILSGARDHKTATSLDGADEDQAERPTSGYDLALAEDDYVLGALLLYTDIINLFLWMLRLLAARDM